jgi:ankyrin repeat protein
VPLLKQFAKLNPDSLNTLSEHGKERNCPLYLAAWGQLKAVQYLLEAGADPFLGNSTGWPPVVAAIHRGKQDIFFVLMDAAAKKVSKDQLEKKLTGPKEYSLLHIAAQFDNANAARSLIDHYGFSRLSKEKNGWTPIQIAAHFNAIHVFEQLCDHSQLNPETNTERNCLKIAAANGSNSVLDRILRQNPSKDIVISALEEAIKNHQTNCAHLLLRHVNQTDMTFCPFQVLFEREIQKGDYVEEDKLMKTLEVLLEDKRIDINSTTTLNSTPLGLAKDIPRAARLILEDPRLDLSKPIHQDGPIGFFVALDLGVWGAVRRYIKEYGYPEGSFTDHLGNTVLHLLTKPNAPNDLIETQINQVSSEQLNSVNKQGQTPFTGALNAKNWDLAARMIDTGRLHLGAAGGFQGEVYSALKNAAPDALLSKMATSTPALFSKTDRVGWTILHHIAAHNRTDWAEKISPYVKDPTAWTVLDSMGRKPLDLGGEALRSMVSDVTECKPLPIGKNWDANVGWHKGDSKSAKPYVERTKKALKTKNENCEARGWVVERGSLSFYPGSDIVKVHSNSWQHRNRAYYFLENGNEIFHLNGTSPPIHEFHSKHSLSLNIGNALDYLRFFCFFVRGEEGAFFIFDHVNDMLFSEDMSLADRKELATASYPAWIITASEEGFEACSQVFYGKQIFGAYFFIQTTGMIEMRDDFPIMEKLSGYIDAPIL